MFGGNASALQRQSPRAPACHVSAHRPEGAAQCQHRMGRKLCKAEDSPNYSAGARSLNIASGGARIEAGAVFSTFIARNTLNGGNEFCRLGKRLVDGNTHLLGSLRYSRSLRRTENTPLRQDVEPLPQLPARTKGRANRHEVATLDADD